MKNILRTIAMMALLLTTVQLRAQITQVYGTVSDDWGPLFGVKVCEMDGTDRIVESAITDLKVNDAPRRVITENGLYNIMGREYWIETMGSGANERTEIYNASDVVVHQIDGVLLYDKSQKKPWREEINWNTNN